METLKDLVAAGREREGTALDIDGRAAPYSYQKFCTNAWKAGNLLGHYGVHSLGELAVVVGPKAGDGEIGSVDAPDPLLAILGGTLLGATVDLTPASPVESRTVVTPAGPTGKEIPPECTHLAYGGPPEDPSVVHFEREVWSENPIEPPEPVASDDGALRADEGIYTHESILDGARDIVEQFGLATGDSVVLAADATDPGTLVAGVLAPLSVGARVEIPAADTLEATDPETLVSAETSLVVTDSESSDEKVVSAPAVTRSLRDTRRA